MSIHSPTSAVSPSSSYLVSQLHHILEVENRIIEMRNGAVIGQDTKRRLKQTILNEPLGSGGNKKVMIGKIMASGEVITGRVLFAV